MTLFGRNVDLLPYRPATFWRKIAVGTWKGPTEPNIYATLRVDATDLERRIGEDRARGLRTTVLTYLIKSVAMALAENPDANVLLRFGRVYHRRDVHIFTAVLAGEKGEELTGILLQRVDQKDVPAIAEEISAKSQLIRAGIDQAFESMRRSIQRVPRWFMHTLLSFLSFVLYTMNWYSSLLGMERDAFGCAQVTSIGGFGSRMEGFAPLDPYARNTLSVAAAALRDEAVVIDGRIEARPILPLYLTIDHRVIDGLAATRLANAIERHLTEALRRRA